MEFLMALARDHDLHRRRLGRNVGLFVVLAAFAVLVFGLTIAKVSGGGAIQAFDHTPRSLDPARALAPVAGRGE
jgi:hypothetical protein